MPPLTLRMLPNRLPRLGSNNFDINSIAFGVNLQT